ncbi:hypothetical protein H0I29_13650 [Polaribacter sp. R2A056_3_33]|uniref:hypothetical protein n=1 Tax=Polaribacter sp. R2A056_3_33 TaxID=2745563 RepID=UPI001C50018D|nr:hypothetical protein [Polaribacter sp. R2A056_3_33]QXP69653.1 hypothetical protein H0I29_13650 [Polaribacter sp. R2A056_3_33]
MNVVIKKAINTHVTISKNKFKYTFFKPKKDLKGSKHLSCKTGGFVFLLISSDNKKKQFKKFISNVISSKGKVLKSNLSNLDGIFQVFVHDKKNKKTEVFSDALGIGAFYYLKKDASFVFFENYYKIEKLEQELTIAPLGLFSQLTFGYRVDPFPELYKELKKVKAAIKYTIKGNEIVEDKFTFLESKPNLNKAIKAFAKESNKFKNVTVGITAGRDCLTILSTLKDKNNIELCNFGSEDAADVKQGKIISKKLNLPFKNFDNVSEVNFLNFANSISNISGGLSTLSYVDMVSFASNIPDNSNYLMGEAGACVRLLLDHNLSNKEQFDEYLTPDIFVNKVINDKHKKLFSTQRSELLGLLEDTYCKDENSAISINFYRQARMPGNFGNRHKILNVYADKTSPFLAYNFMKHSYGLEKSNFIDDNLHHQIILKSNNSLEKYFKFPLEKTDTTVQDWNHRFTTYIGAIYIKIIEENFDVLKEFLDKEATIELCKEQIKDPGRGIYFLHRLISLLLFLSNFKNKASNVN